jgi:3-oxoacyl-[acyl-carrier-protein] synthase-1
LAALALRDGFIPGGAHTEALDPALRANYVRESRAAPLGRVLSNSFGFGGTNCSLVLGRG